MTQQPFPLPEGLSAEETNAFIDAAAAKSRQEIFRSGLPTEAIVEAQAKLRQEVKLTKEQAKGKPGFFRELVLGEGSEIGDTGFRVNIPLLMVGIGIATAGFSLGAGAGIAADAATVGGIASRIPGVTSALGLAARTGVPQAISKTPLVPSVGRSIARHPFATGLAATAAVGIGGLVNADTTSPTAIVPTTPTTEEDVAASIAAIQQAVPSATEPTGPQFGGTGIPDIDQFLPRFEEVMTPFGRAVVTMQPQVIGGQVVGFESVDVRFPDRDTQREERELAEFESEQQQDQINIIKEQLGIANFLADPGNRLRLQATQALTAGTGSDVLGQQEAGVTGPQVNQPNQIFGRQSGQLGALLGLDPSANVPLGSADNQPFSATPSFSALQDLNPDQLSELNALAQIGFGSDLSTLERAAKKKQLPGGGRRPLATFGR